MGLKMLFQTQHLKNAYQVDLAILREEERIVIIRFGRDWDRECMQMDYKIKCKEVE